MREGRCFHLIGLTHGFLVSSSPRWPVPDITTYRLYGLTLASDYAFANRLVEGAGVPDLYFSCTSDVPRPSFWDRPECVYASPSLDGEPEEGELRTGLYRQAGDEVLHFAAGTDFYLGPDRITAHLRNPDYAYGVEIWLLGTVLTYWMERRGFPMLHASAAVVDGRAAAFLATNRGGKSSLAAALMQAGHPLLTDDLLPVELKAGAAAGRPGYPQMRFWPDQAAHFMGSYEDLDRVVPHLDKRRVPVGPGGLGAFCATAQPLACFYLPERRASDDPDTTVDIQPVSPLDAVKELVRHSFLPNLIAAAGLQPRRLEVLAQAARSVPLRRLSYPSGLEHLPRVREAILEDVRAR